MALTNVLILKYNNYLDRIIKQPLLCDVTIGLESYENVNTTAQYIYESPTYYEKYENINFYKKNGLTTDLVLNTTKEGCDYLVEYIKGTSDQNNVIISRWFIIDCNQQRSGQNSYTLKRDIITDNLDSIAEAPMYVEKATIQNIDDIAIFNQEEISFNQIKKEETLLKDKSKIPWIVGYFAQNTPQTQINIEPAGFNPIRVNNLSAWEYNTYRTNNYKVLNAYNIISYVHVYFGQVDYTTFVSLTDSGYSSPTTVDAHLGAALANKKKVLNELAEMPGLLKAHSDDLRTMLINKFSLKEVNNITHLNNTYIYDESTAKLYRITVNDLGNVKTHALFDRGSAEEVQVNGYFSGLSRYHYPAGVGGKSVEYDITTHDYKLDLTEVSSVSTSITIPATARKLSDAPYKMFAIPAGVITDNTKQGTTVDKLEALNIAARISETLGSNCYDIQLLPFCPLQSILNTGASGPYLEYSHQLTENIDYTVIKAGNTYKSIIFYCPVSTVTFDIGKIINQPTNVVDKKIVNQCDMYRLCSPNYSANFDFNVLKTKNISLFNVDITFKPFNPYIHINPVWNNTSLYGPDFNDTRGLICQGDFSIPIVNDEWKQYQINNKNYLNAFNRDTDSIELNNKYNRIQDKVNAITGSIQGAVAGAAAGNSFGGPTGAAIGGVVGGISSGIGGAYDVKINNILRNEALDLRQDQFNYSLQNIQARPNTLAKVSSFDANNKIFPVLEYYTCTDQEKDIFKNKMKYNGMSIMRIDKLNNFWKYSTEQYFKGKLIRLNDLGCSYYEAAEIANELNQGVYITKPNTLEVEV